MNALALLADAADLLAVLLWLLSAIAPRFPAKFGSPYSAPPPELLTLVKALKMQGRLSAAAAMFTALGVALGIAATAR